MKRMNYWHYWIIVLPGNELFITLTIHYIFQQTKSCTLFLHFITKLNDMHSLVRLLFILLNLALSWSGANLFFFLRRSKRTIITATFIKVSVSYLRNCIA